MEGRRFALLLVLALSVHAVVARRRRMRVFRNTCNLPMDPGSCLGYYPRFYYDPGTMTCRGFTYGGCEGNGNRFLSEMECRNRCIGFRTLRIGICNQPMDPGSCLGAFPKFYYDSDTMMCKPFTYGGCEGNGNRFDSKRECIATCFGSGL